MNNLARPGAAQPASWTSRWASKWTSGWVLRWQHWGPVRRVFAMLLAFLMLILLACVALIANELIAKNLISTSENLEITSENINNDLRSAAVARGAYLAKVGNCSACHTARGGDEFAGGKAIHTPFGAVYTSNITPDKTTGIGRWSADAFYRALHEGRSANGRLLTPAFPYTNTTHVTRADSDDLYAYFMHGVPAVAQTNLAHDLPWLLGTQLALAVWRTLFFEVANPAAQLAVNAAAANQNSTKSIANYVISTSENIDNSAVKSTSSYADLARGAYLVRGLGHCSACHAERNALGATQRGPASDPILSGGLMPMQDWYAPSLMDSAQAGVMHWPQGDVVALLKTGISPHATVAGPMAEVVSKSTQYWTDADLRATAAYLQSLPDTPLPNRGKPSQNSQFYVRGEALFAQHCATCHGAQGEGVKLNGNVALPALAGNRAVSLHTSANLVRIIMAGGYAPSTAGNPRPYGMPPFVHVLGDEDIAAVTTYIRGSWGNKADAVSAADVVRHRKGLVQ